MVYRLGISLTNFKDLTSPSGEILTTYVIRVMYNRYGFYELLV